MVQPVAVGIGYNGFLGGNDLGQGKDFPRSGAVACTASAPDENEVNRFSVQKAHLLLHVEQSFGHLHVAQRQVLVDGTDLADWCRNQRSSQIDRSR